MGNPICVIGDGECRRFMEQVPLGGVYRFYPSPESFREEVAKRSLAPGEILCSPDLSPSDLDIVLNPSGNPSGPQKGIAVLVREGSLFAPHKPEWIKVVPMNERALAGYLGVSYTPQTSNGLSSPPPPV
ncbi:hypothetical protein HYV84_04045 [Candidatus Woesearchaeota archaeon]|nr:hypothetical protein [Candidatus Woesearchaeota archaeon]